MLPAADAARGRTTSKHSSTVRPTTRLRRWRFVFMGGTIPPTPEKLQPRPAIPLEATLCLLLLPSGCIVASMAHRTFAIGDIHGDLEQLLKLLSCLPGLDKDDTIVFLGDYVDRGPQSAQVVDYIRRIGDVKPAKIVTLRGNHEDAWLKVIDNGWPEFVLPVGNGCLAAYRSFIGALPPREDEEPTQDELDILLAGSFFPPDVVEWFRGLPLWYEDEYAIYVHAGLSRGPDGNFRHPQDTDPPGLLLWCRDEDFFRNYKNYLGKPIVFGHTGTEYLPPELSEYTYTPEDPTDLWAGEAVIGLDTGCGKGGFLTAFELPEGNVYESR
jgi:serine/threonine protein phosphatase 1